MILILTKSEIEFTTDRVIDWLQYYGAEYVRLNIDNLTENLTIKNGNIYINGCDLNAITVCWLRRTGGGDISNIINQIQIRDFKFLSGIQSNLFREKKNILNYLYYKLSKKLWLTYPNELEINKLEILDLAKKSGFNVPDQLITSNKKEIASFLEKKNFKVISKSISDFLKIDNGAESYSFLTVEANADVLEKIDENNLFISLFQERIEKEYELRVFFFDKQLYPMAIFSQSDNSTSLDYRNYNYVKPNRVSKYALSEKIKVNIFNFLELTKMTSGSIDLIKEKGSEKYYFLEVNPVGQFSNVSSLCNYYIKKKIAEYLINEKNRVQETL